MRTYQIIASGALLAALVAGCASTPMSSGATAQLAARSGSSVSGTVSFMEEAGALRVQTKVSGLTPGQHGFHVHEIGDCSAPDASSAKGHFNPASKEHGQPGAPQHHQGDLPNLTANAQGEASASFEVSGVALTGANGIVGRSVVIHADPDDYRSQPAGNSGKRIACGVIVAR